MALIRFRLFSLWQGLAPPLSSFVNLPFPQETPLLSKHVSEVITFCIRAGSEANFDEENRVMALNSLVMTIK